MCNNAVSILIPVYDVQTYIAKCLESVASQTYGGQMECIIVDDCGYDDSIAIAEEFIAGYDGPISFRIIHHKNNRGLAAARNTGVAAAQGDFVFHLDGDDWIEPTAIELLIKKQQDTDADIVSGNFIRHCNEGDILHLIPDFATPMDMVYNAIELKGDHCVCMRLIRKSLYTDNGISAVEGVDISEDYHTLPRLAYYANRIAKIDDVIYHYNRLNPNSYTTTAAQGFSMKRFWNISSSIDILLDFFADKDSHCVKRLSASKRYHIYWSLYLCCGLNDKISFQIIKQENAISLSYNFTLLIVLLYKRMKLFYQRFKHAMMNVLLIMAGLVMINLTSCQTPYCLDKGETEVVDIPTSIEILNVNPIYLSMGAQASIEFSVNPSNAPINLSGDDCQIELDKVGTVQTRSSYVTTPSNYKLVRIEQVYDNNTKEMIVGQYRAIIEDTNLSAEYDEMVALVINVEDTNGNKVQISSNAFEVKGTNYDNLPKTGLPIVIVNTPNSDPITSKVDWMTDATMTIINPDMSFDYQGTLSIKGRGNSTWNYPKKPYALKLDKKEKILGMKKHKRWCLLANWIDRTLMRNAVAFEISKQTELAWTPSGKFVELLLNGKHMGNFYLCEQIKVDENRVDITVLDPKATEGEGITGGYIFELDTHYDELYKFRSSTKYAPWMFKDPDEVNEAQFKWAQNYVNEMEKALYDNTKFKNRDFEKYMNLESYVDWWLVNELSMNDEIKHPKSCYMYKDVNGKMIAGPVWDFDWGTFTPGATSSFCCMKLYYPRLFEDPQFVSLVKTHWAKYKTAFETKIPAFIDSIKPQLENSDEINAPMWPIGGSRPNGDEDMSFDQAVARMKDAYLTKLSWLDAKIKSW